MPLSKDTVRPVWPKDLSSIVSEGTANHTPRSSVAFLPGTVVVRDASNELVACDANTHIHEPVEVVWTDGTTRFDVDVVESDGSEKTRYTTLVGPFIADLNVSLFDAPPAVGEVVVKSAATAGNLASVNDAGLQLLLDSGGDGGAQASQGHGLVIGKILSVSGDFVRCKIG